jgi:beta-1,4-N-acetylglucosaminyltransferase
MANKLTIGIISSKGGHLFQINQLRPFWKKHERFWVTDQGLDTDYFLKNERIYFGFFPDSRNIINAVKNLFLAINILRKEKPNILLSSGAGITVPFFIIGKIFHKTKLIFIEPYDFIQYPSLTGKIVYHFVDLFLVQHNFQKRWYPKAEYWGQLF